MFVCVCSVYGLLLLFFFFLLVLVLYGVVADVEVEVLLLLSHIAALYVDIYIHKYKFLHSFQCIRCTTSMAGLVFTFFFLSSRV